MAGKQKKALRGACIVAQSGGPTAVINASICGAISAAIQSPYITRVLGAQNGIKGLLEERFFDLEQEEVAEIKFLTNTPGAALGTCRYRLPAYEEDKKEYRQLLKIFKKYDVRYFFYNGGNDSMDTCNKIAAYLQRVKYTCRVIGIPKTIDNDLCGTDHCPGYGSAAKYIATSMAELATDTRSYDPGSVVIAEIMGRNAGWLTAASALAKEVGAGPDLIYLPEVPFVLDMFLARTAAIYQDKGSCVVAVSEGIKDEKGVFIAAYADERQDAFGHVQMGGVAAVLAAAVKNTLGCKVRAIEFSLLQRSAAHLVSQIDMVEAYSVGVAAVEQAVSGASSQMIGLVRLKEEAYNSDIVMVPLEEAANLEKTVPRDWISEIGDNVTDAFVDYALPLIQGEAQRVYENGLPRYARLQKVPATPGKAVEPAAKP